MDINTGERMKEDERNLPLDTILRMEARDPLLDDFAKREANQILDQNMRSNIYIYAWIELWCNDSTLQPFQQPKRDLLFCKYFKV
jgi:hypothetical protein